MTDSALPGAVRLPDGSWVRGRGLRNPTPAGPSPEYGLYLGSKKMREKYTIEWAHDWIEWPDFLLPRDSARALVLIRGLHERAKAGEAVEVACGGGIGRTGTVMSVLAVLAGVAPAEAVAWTRVNYHPKAVETPWQRRWIMRSTADLPA
ncbi:protein-tyrosine phosphatase family protein [Actinocrispum wychmicini]|uniref:Protein-tyrosine phosphatase n=1 Tax=Actinocrispum wychmicini TaxID=1213861 RepID=A0A4R2JKY0_9PSEU|nr:protein-tyrosine phosphatase family protein [Actinocrispum wychmicini]TCO59212.1 protein-tyrosine phosphatase [Actinocrispum wychmicini]